MIKKITMEQALKSHPLAVEAMRTFAANPDGPPPFVVFHDLGGGELGADIEDAPFVWDPKGGEWEEM